MSKFGMAVIEQGFFMTAIKVIDKGIKKLAIRCIRRFTKVQDNKILFLNFTGNYDCNPKWICEEFIKEKAPVKLVWGINKQTRLGSMFFPKNVKTVVRDTFSFYKEIASAKVIIDNGISTSYLKYPKKRSQYLIETWHGSLGIKKFGRSANKDKSWLRKAAREGKMTDFIISNSTYEDAIYREDFWKKTKIWQFGHARNDILFCKDKKKIASLQNKLRKEYGIPADAKLCMYAPTFRDDGDLSPYLIDYSALSSALKERFGGEWVILTRFHARIKNLVKYYTLPENVVNVSGYVDIQELMLCIDVGITDYSSWICEYMLTRKPGFMFATDVNDFSKHERTLFFPLSELPFPAASDVDTLIKNIKSFDEEKFVDDCNKFLEDKGSIDDGHAAERIVKEIRKIINC